MPDIHSVAKEAGVSISTVSYVMSGKRSISEPTKKRVFEAVERLGYQPDMRAKMLASGRTHLLAVSQPFRGVTDALAYMTFVLETSLAAREEGFDVILLTDSDPDSGITRVAGSGLAEAVIALDVAPDDKRVKQARDGKIPFVFIGIPDDTKGLTCVDFDFERAAAMATATMAGMGHKRLTLVGQPTEFYTFSNFAPRVRDSFTSTCEKLCIESDIISPSQGFLGDSVAEALEQGTTGFVLHCLDEDLLRTLRAIDRAGLKVPDDVSVICVAPNMSTARLDQPLDSLPLRPAETCREAISLALSGIGENAEQNLEPGVHLIEPVYMPAGSVAAPPETSQPLVKRFDDR